MKKSLRKMQIAFVLILMFITLSASVYASDETMTWNPLDKGTGVSLSNDNLTVSTSVMFTSVRATKGVNSGKWYWEIKSINANPGYGMLNIGVASSALNINSSLYGQPDVVAFYDYGYIFSKSSYRDTFVKYSDADIIGVALDADNRKVAFYKNGALVTTENCDFTGDIFPWFGNYQNAGPGCTANFGATAFQQSIPVGYSSFISVKPLAPGALTVLAGNSQNSITWTAVTDATSYNIKRATTAGGPYTTVGTSTTTNYIDQTVNNGTTYYYVATAVGSAGESANSNEVNATPMAPLPTGGNKAILEITMINGYVNEFDLTAAELQAFTNWYDAKSEGSGKAYFTFVRKNNIKPFLSRKITIAYDKILSFEVKDYNEQ